MLLAMLLWWLLECHFVLNLSSDYYMFLIGLGIALVNVAFVWLSYMALEPYVRRRWPSVLISWARLSSGKLRDPLIGRDILAGAMCATIAATVAYLETTLPSWTNISGLTPHSIDYNSLNDLRSFASVFVGLSWLSVEMSLGLLALLFLTRVIFRRNWLATGITGVVAVAVTLTQPNIFVDFLSQTIFAGLAIFLLIRFGLFAVAMYMFPYYLLTNMPINLGPSHWYTGRSLFLLLFIVALVLYGFRTALAGRPVFGNLAVDD
jgi:hypothetical protein